MEKGNMMNKKLLTAALAATLMSGAGYSQAEDEFAISGNIALTSDYRFRGISQSDESPAVQGGFDASFSPGFYIGTWGSSVDFDNNEDYDGSIEIDYYGGWKSAIGDTDFSIDVGYIYYDYPGDTGADGDYQEFKVVGSWKALAVSVYYSDDYYAGTDEAWYYSADYSQTLFTDELTLGLHLGYQQVEEGEGFFSSDEDGYTDYSVKLSYAVFGVSLSVAYVGADLDEDDVFGTDWAEDTAVFTISKSM
jgi:uncharacterized protein (TIGR02001 family)